jgi:hypothetical protein
MNEVRLLKVARAIREAHAHGMAFDMDRYHTCGTPGCAIGHYVAREDLQDEYVLLTGYVVGHIGMKITGQPLEGDYMTHFAWHFDITRTEALELFAWDGCSLALHDALKAAEYVERFVERHREIKPVNPDGGAESLDRDTISRAGSIPCSPVQA